MTDIVAKLLAYADWQRRKYAPSDYWQPLETFIEAADEIKRLRRQHFADHGTILSLRDQVARLKSERDKGFEIGRLQSDVESAYAEIERLRRDTHINGEFRLQPQSQSGHKVPGSHVWWQQAGTVEVDGEEWQGLVYFFASPKMESEMDGVISSEDDSHDFTVGEFNCVGGWNNTTIDFSSPLGNLSIDCIGVDCCE